jgi:hypothetical protein
MSELTVIEDDAKALIAKIEGEVKTEAVTIEPEILSWAKNFLSTITPVIKQAAEDSVLAAVSVPGTGAVKAAAALASATADLVSKGVPVIENNLKAAIQIAYTSLPTSVTSTTAATAVLNAADTEVDTVATKIEDATAIPVA